MYNYYSNIKKTNQINKLNKNIEEEEKLKNKRKIEVEKLSHSYENRIRNFVYNMAADPKKIKDYNNNVISTRKEFYDENIEKIIGRHGFILKGYKTEKERINDYLKEKNASYLGYSNYNNSKSFNMDDDVSKHKNKESPQILVQPNMRFKPRSDIERIFDINNQYNLGRVDKRIIERHLQALGLNYGKHVYVTIENNEDYLPQFLPNYDIKATIEKKKNTEIEKSKKKIDIIRKNRKETYDIREKRYAIDEIPMKQILVDSKNIMGDLHSKTFFKGATNFTLFKDKSNKFLKTNKELLQTKLTKKSTSQENIKTVNPVKSFISNDIKADVVHMNPLLYNLNLNPFKKLSEEKIDDHAFLELKELAFKKDPDQMAANKKTSLYEKLKSSKKALEILKEDEYKSSNNYSKYSDNLDFIVKKTDDDKIKIGNNDFNKDDIQQITKVVLTQCNFFHSKNKNNSNCLKVGNGKLMHTNGMTISDFSKKYHLSSSPFRK